MANRFEVQSIFTGKDKVSGVLGKVSGQVNRFMTSIKSGFMKSLPIIKDMGRQMFDLGKKVVAFGGIAVGAIGYMIAKFADAGEALYDFSKASGVGVEAIQEWRFVADQTGVSADELDASFMKLSKSIGQARAGSGRLAGFLKKSNPELLKQLKITNSTDQAFELIINKLGTMTNQNDKAALASLAFGDAGQKFISMAKEGAPAIAKMREEARRMGLITEQNAEESDRFNDSLATAKMALMGVRNTIAGQLLPVLTPLIQRFTEFVVANRGKFQAWAAEFAKDLPQKIESIIDGFKELAPVVGAVFDQLKSIDRDDILQVVDVFKTFFTIAKGVATVLGVVVKFLTFIGETIGGTAGFLGAVARGDWAGIAGNNRDSLVENTMKRHGMNRADATTFLDYAGKHSQSETQAVLSAWKNKQREQKQPPSPVSPAERTSRAIQENNSTVSHEVTLTNKTAGTAAVASKPAAGSRITVINTGDF